MEDRAPQDRYAFRLGLGFFRLLGDTLKPTSRRTILLLPLASIALGAILDSLRSPLWEVFGALGFAGLLMYIGALLLIDLPGRSQDARYYVVAIVWIVGGMLTLVIPAFAWILQGVRPIR